MDEGVNGMKEFTHSKKNKRTNCREEGEQKQKKEVGKMVTERKTNL